MRTLFAAEEGAALVLFVLLLVAFIARPRDPQLPPWWTNPWARMIVTSFASPAALLANSLALAVWPRYPGWQLVTAFLLAVLVGNAAYQLLALVKAILSRMPIDEDRG